MDKIKDLRALEGHIQVSQVQNLQHDFVFCSRITILCIFPFCVCSYQSFDFYPTLGCFLRSHLTCSCSFLFLNFGFVYMNEMVDNIKDLRVLKGHRQVSLAQKFQHDFVESLLYVFFFIFFCVFFHPTYSRVFFNFGFL